MLFKVSIVLSLAIALINCELCSEKNCTCITQSGQTEVTCTSLGLTEVPTFKDLPKNSVLLDFGSNQIKEVGILEEVDGIKTLKLDHNAIESIQPIAFSKYNYLQNLDLCHNRLHRLEPAMLEGLSGLRTLNLSHNIIRSLSSDVFHDVDQLVELRLSGNPLHYIRYELFRKLTRLFTLDLSSTALTGLPPDIFHDLQFMEELDLSDNGFENVPTAGLQSAIKLRHLKLNGNPIFQLKANSFQKVRALEILELSDMGSLQSIKAGAFAGLKLLRVLKITGNKNLQSLHFGAFEGLYKHFDDSWILEELYLRQNDLNTIQSPSTALCKIKVLDLQGNPWDCDCKMSWITICDDLKPELTTDLRCSHPKNLENRLIPQVGADEMTCPKDEMAAHQQKVLRIVVVTSGMVGIIFCAIIIVVVIKKRKIMEWWYYRKRGSGAVYYVKANAGAKEGPGEL